MLAYANDSGRIMVLENEFQQMKRKFTYAIPNNATYELGSILPDDFWKFVPDSHYYIFQQLGHYLIGPVDDHMWRELRIEDSYSSGIGEYPIYFQFRDNGINLYPSPQAGTSLIFEYYSKHWIAGADNNRKELFANDNDQSLIPDVLIEKDIEWRYNRDNGYPFEDQKAEYIYMLRNAKKPSYMKRRAARTITYGGPNDSWSRHRSQATY